MIHDVGNGGIQFIVYRSSAEKWTDYYNYHSSEIMVEITMQIIIMHCKF